LAFILLFAIAGFVLAVSVEGFEQLVAWTREQESWQADELMTALIISPIALSIFALRRWQEAKREIQKRQRAETKYRSIFEHATEGIFQTTLEGRYLSANPMLASLYGYNSPSELMAETRDIQHPPYVEPNRREEFKRLIQEQGAVWNFESQVYRQDGSIIWISENARPLYDDQSQLLGYEGTVAEITARKQTELIQSQLAAIVESSEDAIISETLDGRITSWNAGAQRILGYSAEEVMGQSVAILLPPNHLDQELTLLEKIKQGKYIDHYETQRRCKDGTLIAISLSISPIRNQAGKIVGASKIARDITQQKRAEQELQQAKESAVREAARSAAANRAKSEFLATMSHEIRTPLNGIIGMTGLLLNTALTPQQRDFAETIRSSGDNLLTIINDILDFSKIESHKLELEQQPFSLRSCIEEALDLLATQAVAKNLELACLLDPQVPPAIIGDVTRLRQVLVNLLGNAIKFTESGEVTITVTARPSGGSRSEQLTPKHQEQNQRNQTVRTTTAFYEIQFAVQDTGIGIAAEGMDRLFQSFSQVDASTTRKYGGTGLGLAISKRLSEMMGGRMWAESQPGQGSTFYFTIAAQAATSLFPETPEDDQQTQLANKRLLIVDDNAINRKILTLQTQAWGMLPHAAASGPEALEWLHRGERFDLAILDMQMPQMDGVDLAAQIRQLPGCRELPLLILSSMGRPNETLLQGADVNFAAFLSKPIKQSQLYNVLTEALGTQPIQLKPTPVPARPVDTQPGQKLPLRILLAEDHLVNQKLALFLLEKLGYRADVAANGLEVLEALHRQPYDVVLMDVQMPEMDGLEASRRICQDWSPEERPWIIAMTANAMQGDREQCLAAGMDDYLSKPIKVEALVEALQRCPSRCQPPSPEQGSKSADHPAVDTRVLQELQALLGDNGAALVGELIDCYLEDSPKLLQAMATAIAQTDGETLRRAAHTLKSSSADQGAILLSGLCKELEDIGRTGTLTGAAAKVAQAETEYERVQAALRAKRQRGNDGES